MGAIGRVGTRHVEFHGKADADRTAAWVPCPLQSDQNVKQFMPRLAVDTSPGSNSVAVTYYQSAETGGAGASCVQQLPSADSARWRVASLRSLVDAYVATSYSSGSTFSVVNKMSTVGSGFVLLCDAAGTVTLSQQCKHCPSPNSPFRPSCHTGHHQLMYTGVCHQSRTWHGCLWH